jgi:hypothetical protein
VGPVEPGTELTPAAEAEPVTPPVPLAFVAKEPKRFTMRFALAYAGLGVVFAAAVTGLIVLVIQPGHHAGPSW